MACRDRDRGDARCARRTVRTRSWFRGVSHASQARARDAEKSWVLSLHVDRCHPPGHLATRSAMARGLVRFPRNAVVRNESVVQMDRWPNASISTDGRLDATRAVRITSISAARHKKSL